MRIIFMGTPDFAIPSLRILLEHGSSVISVVTAPDKPQGRGQKVAPSPVKTFAAERNIPVLQPDDLKASDFVSAVSASQPDLIVVVAFRILPPEVFRIPRLGSINLHASLLPKYRGAAPISWAIINGEEETGVTTFFLKEKVDTGSMIMQARLRIGPDETAGELHDRLAELGAQVVLQTVRAIELGNVSPQVQDESLATRAPKIYKEDCRIRWRQPALRIHNFVRGLSPHPCAWTVHNGKVIRIYRTSCFGASELGGGVSGKVVSVDADRLVVCTGEGLLSIDEVQMEGRKRMGIAEFLRGYSVIAGDKFGNS
jgi:methionyl-tRNA formyltransferase